MSAMQEPLNDGQYQSAEDHASRVAAWSLGSVVVVLLLLVGLVPHGIEQERKERDVDLRDSMSAVAKAFDEWSSTHPYAAVQPPRDGHWVYLERGSYNAMFMNDASRSWTDEEIPEDFPSLRFDETVAIGVSYHDGSSSATGYCVVGNAAGSSYAQDEDMTYDERKRNSLYLEVDSRGTHSFYPGDGPDRPHGPCASYFDKTV